ncbi:hypothetical protein GCM10029964_120450 [Kibdelosporangium lantanae]
MPTTAPVTAERTQDVFATVRKLIALYGVISVIVLGTVAATTFFAHQPASAFMWIRGGLLPVVAPLLTRWATRAEQGTRAAFDRLRTVTTVMPIAIIAVDLIPGVCPTWYAVMQGISVLPLIAVGVITRGGQMRAMFPKAA